VNLLQTAVQLVVYQIYGIESQVTYVTTWGSQAVVIVARAAAACEFCHALLGRYQGVWALAKRILLICSVIVLGLGIYFGKDGFIYGVMKLEISSEAFIATLVVGTFLFAKHYDVEMELNLALLGLGLGVYSCVKILNDAVLSRFFYSYGSVWNGVAMTTFVAVLALWIFAMRATSPVHVPKPELSSGDLYRTLAPQMNRRLAELNEQLIRLWKLEPPK